LCGHAKLAKLLTAISIDILFEEQADARILAASLVNTYVHSVISAEFKRWLERQGESFEPAKGGHVWVFLRGRRAILPMHGSRKEMKRGTVAAIKKQLGLE